MLEEIWPAVGQSWAVDLEIFGEGSEFMVRYRIEAKERPSMKMAEYIRFDGDRICEIEVYAGREPGDQDRPREIRWLLNRTSLLPPSGDTDENLASRCSAGARRNRL